MKLTDIKSHADMVASIQATNAGFERMMARVAADNEATYGNPNGSLYGPGAGTN